MFQEPQANPVKISNKAPQDGIGNDGPWHLQLLSGGELLGPQISIIRQRRTTEGAMPQCIQMEQRP